VENVGDSHYNSLQLEFNRRNARGLTSQVSYTFSKNIGLAESGSVPTDHFNYKIDRGRLDADITHMLVANVVYELPFGSNRAMLKQGVLSHVLGNWAVSSVIAAHSGLPFSVIAGSDVNGDGNNTDRATILPGQSLDSVYASGLSDQTQFLAPQAQVLNIILAPKNGTLLGRNTFNGPMLFNIDLGVQRNVHITEEKYFEFRAEFFNALNHTNFSNPNNTLTSPLFGKVLSTATNSRQAQLAVKFYF
jgi:hypothetical protein